MCLEVVICAGLDPFENNSVGSLYLTIGLRMRCQSDDMFNLMFGTEALPLSTHELSPIIGDNFAWNAEVVHYALKELHGNFHANILDRLRLHPLAKHVDPNEEEFKPPWCH